MSKITKFFWAEFAIQGASPCMVFPKRWLEPPFENRACAVWRCPPRFVLRVRLRC